MSEKATRTTLREVAALAGVSAPTISKVLNGRADVAPATRARVMQVLREEQYLPRGASTLPMSHTHIELVFDSLVNPNNLEMIRGVVGVANNDGAHVVISTVPARAHPREWVNELRRAGREGLIMVTSRLSLEQQDRLREAELPLVMVDPVFAPGEGLHSVGATNWQGGLSATQHLLQLGHRRIAMLRGEKTAVDDARYHGYVAALSDAGIALDPRIVARAHFRPEPAQRETLRILQLPDPPTALFASNDGEAIGVLEAARQLGLRVPDDLSVTSFDDSVLAVSAWPHLTSVRQPFAQMGATAYGMLADLIAGREPAALRVELATTLVVRSSTAPPPRGGGGHD